MEKVICSRFCGLLVVLLLMVNCSSPDSTLLKDKPAQFAHASMGHKDTNLVEKIMKEPSIKIDSSISKDYLVGKFDPTKHPDFVLIDKAHASREGMYLRKEAYDAFVRMAEAAKKENVHFQIRSATRNFEAQKTIWEAKWTGQRILDSGENAAKAFPDSVARALKILEYSSMPGTSRHHWGTDMDFNSFVNSYFEKGKGLREYEWLLKHAAEYHFCQPYTAKGVERPDGYNEEKWHWSYLPIATTLTNQYQLRIKDKDISGFEGANIAKEIEVIRKYVLGINKACLATTKN